MAKRTVIQIDEDLCIGCRRCVRACHEGAIGMVNGKARLLRDDYCDGLGDCLPACPTDAISFIEREAAPYDEAAVIAHLEARDAAEHKAEDDVDAVVARSGKHHGHGKHKGGRVGYGDGLEAHAAASKEQAEEYRKERHGEKGGSHGHHGHRHGHRHGENASAGPASGCPGSAARELRGGCPGSASRTLEHGDDEEGYFGGAPIDAPSRLMQWPAQIKLVPTKAPYYSGRGLLVAADCSAFACAGFHERFMKGNVTVIGCPKLDDGDYTEKLTDILAVNDVTSLTVARMEVPCCGGIERAAANALKASGKSIPFKVVTFSVTGDVVCEVTGDSGAEL